MALYLQMDGVDDYLQPPSITFNEIVMDFIIDSYPATDYYFDARSELTGGYYNDHDGLGPGWTSLYINGVLDASRTRKFPIGNRQTIRLVASTTFTKSMIMFARNSTSGNMHGKLFNLKYYNGATIVAHYDMTTGNVNDISGNGKHATLTGGTWLDDGVGGGTTQTASASLVGNGSVSSSSLAIRNSSINLIGTGAFTASQLVVKNAQVDLLGFGSLTANADGISIITGSTDLLGIGSINAIGQREVLGTLSFLGQGVFTVQTSDVTILTADAQLIANGQLSVIDGEPIIGSIKLKADRQLYVYLVAKRDLYISLKGGLDVTAENQSVTMFAGDTKNLDFELLNTDLTGSTLNWVLKKSVGSTEDNLLKTESSGISVLDGLIRVKLEAEDTKILKGVYYHELELTDVLGNESTLATGYFTIKPSGV